ncbi:MAG: TIGR00730 family Rossman fold protein [Betaproteobacteria bacterium]|nr:MAG: TIGR00730 family Rossman fold protein [Betaproteobacteria bacterium]
MSKRDEDQDETNRSEADWPASVCVYCGSSSGDLSDYATAARELGTLLAKRNVRLVFGGGSVGLMGVLADAVLEAGGTVTGVIPNGLRTRELAHEGVTEMIAVDSMHARKQRMVDLADAFIALPGGIGTLDELFETWTWLQLGIHAKPVGLLNVAGYYDPLLTFLQQMSDRQFMSEKHLACLSIETDADRLLEQLNSFRTPGEGKWVNDTRSLQP